MSAQATREPRFPDRVWAHPLLASLDARARSELESAGGVRSLGRGEKLFDVGELADVLYVIIAGEVALRSGGRRSELRRARPGDVVGEEAAARAHATRRHEATSVGSSELALLPAALLRRVMARGDETDVGRRRQRWLARSLAEGTLERADFARDVPRARRELMLDAGRSVELRRGEILHRQGDPSDDVYFLAEGMVQLQSDDAGQRRVLAYHKACDFFGDEALEGRPRDATATAASDVSVFAVRGDVVRKLGVEHPDALAHAVRIQTMARSKQRDVRSVTLHVLADLHRFETSTSLLAIDQSRCLRCGHCAWSCAEAHNDNISRLLRRGDIVVAKVRGRPKTLLLPSSCQHCKNPACMIDCPTGAISRDADGEVHIREELCTGCGSCAKACPWDNIQMAPLPQQKTQRHLPLVRVDAPAVAVKCDLCRDRGGEPACVAACPVDAIERIDPKVDLDDVRAILGDALPPPADRSRSLIVPAVLVATLLASVGAFAALDGAPRRTTGLVLSCGIGLLFTYALVKRFGVRFRRGVRVRGHFVAHMAAGIACALLALAHTRGHSALAVAFWGATFLGAVAGLVGWAAPRRLARIERTALLPEELAAKACELDARVFRDLSGRSDLLKGLYARLLRPFSRSFGRTVVMCTLGTPQRAMRAWLLARVHGIVPKGDERLAGLDGLIALVVERQALRAQRMLTALLRTTTFAHVVVTAGLAVLVVLHVVMQLSMR